MVTEGYVSAILISLVLGGALGLGTRFIIYQIKKAQSKLSFAMSALIGGGASLLTGGLYFITKMNSVISQMNGFSSRFGVDQLAEQTKSITIISILIGTIASIVAVAVMYNQQIIKK